MYSEYEIRGLCENPTLFIVDCDPRLPHFGCCLRRHSGDQGIHVGTTLWPIRSYKEVCEDVNQNTFVYFQLASSRVKNMFSEFQRIASEQLRLVVDIRRQILFPRPEISVTLWAYDIHTLLQNVIPVIRVLSLYKPVCKFNYDMDKRFSNT
jgi:hypothetical protein